MTDDDRLNLILSIEEHLANIVASIEMARRRASLDTMPMLQDAEEHARAAKALARRLKT